MSNRTNSENFLKEKRDILFNKEKNEIVDTDKMKFPLCVCVCVNAAVETANNSVGGRI